MNPSCELSRLDRLNQTAEAAVAQAAQLSGRVDAGFVAANSQLKAGFSGVNNRLDGISSLLGEGFAQVDSRLEGLTYLSQQQLAAQQQQVKLQVQQYLAEQQRRDREAQLHALYVGAADVIHAGLLAVRAIDRQAAQSGCDALALWARLLVVERRSRSLEPARVDPTQRRDLVDLRDAVAQCAEKLQRSFREDEVRLLQWASLEARAHGLSAASSAAVNQLAARRASTGNPVALPGTSLEAKAQLEAAESRVDEIRYSLPEPLPETVSVVVGKILAGPIHPSVDAPDVIRLTGIDARQSLLLLDAGWRRGLVALRWGLTGYVFAGIVCVTFLIVWGATGYWGLMLVGLMLALGVPTAGWLMAESVRRSGDAYFQWTNSEDSRLRAARDEVAFLHFVRDMLSDAEAFAGSPDGGLALAELQQGRPDLAEDVRAAALLA